MRSSRKVKKIFPFQGYVKFVQTTCRISVNGTSSITKENVSSSFLRDKNTKLVVLTGAGISTECGIPDYRNPNGAYSSGFKPITHKEFLCLTRARRQYWTKSYAGWRRFTAAQPGPAHIALSSLEKTSWINFMITQNVDRLHHSAGSNPLELHGTIYNVVCIDCSFRCYHQLFEDQLKALNPKDSPVVPIGGIETILVIKVSAESANQFGELVADPVTNELLHYTEKPETFVSDRINCGVYIFTPDIFNAIQGVSTQQKDRGDVFGNLNAVDIVFLWILVNMFFGNIKSQVIEMRREFLVKRKILN
ncbi:hypothetical protein HYC85_008973 [Camellia sinensis]|uniref:Deacetylase sirtuin-type domain-containing protein n=1 Tax=Camellia sinensis TaxID=4442 RepID=A0A7J7HUP6_CAMSI|nr:hypothetical protein HYC85_008973 [Camellia sinensis]